MRRRCTVKINWCIRRSTQRKWRSDYLRTSRISHQIKPRRLPRDCTRRRIHSWRKWCRCNCTRWCWYKCWRWCKCWRCRKCQHKLGRSNCCWDNRYLKPNHRSGCWLIYHSRRSICWKNDGWRCRCHTGRFCCKSSGRWRSMFCIRDKACNWILDR